MNLSFRYFFFLMCHLVLAVGAVSLTCGKISAAEVTWRAGFSKVEITPQRPVRLAGYGSRHQPSDGVDTALWVRSIAIAPRAVSQTLPAHPYLLISVDTIGLPASLVDPLAKQLEQQHGIPRSAIVFCSTHTHAAPDLVSELSNIFAEPMSEEELAAGGEYRAQLIAGILESAQLAIDDLAPAQLAFAQGASGFAGNRRLLKDGRWSGFGLQEDGPVDHSVPVLRIAGIDGRVRGLVFNYACHCTTMGGEYNRVNAEWAGYAATTLEGMFPGAVALCTIGCGADANPHPRGTVDIAQLHGRTLADEVRRIATQEMTPIEESVQARFDYAALSFDLPTIEELQSRLHDVVPQKRRHAEHMMEVYRRDERLPATYPVPIQSWKFGNALTMVFLGGEVVVDYSLRLKREMTDTPLWVTAYANDVLGYVCSERMRIEQGYEFDQSAIYYNLPGPWAAGTEDLLISRIHDLVNSQGRAKALPPEDSLRTLRVDAAFSVELVVAEPLVTDPINIAFGADGRLWVVEMGDYPEPDVGSDANSDGGGGRIKFLTDTDNDGRYDTATLFLEGLEFPTGVIPWRDGVIVSAAPEIFFAKDSDGDGRADQRETLYSGFVRSNPQHRINGFTYALDHSLHCASGDNLGEILSAKTGQTVNASGHDLRIEPDTGWIETVSGRSQYVRSRNEWGEWFGSDNSQPMYHYVIDSHYLERNPNIQGDGTQQLFDPPVAPPVYPRSPATERFNDLYAANRFTSACSAIVGDCKVFGDGTHDSLFVCEPVHNLVHRSILVPQGQEGQIGASYRSQRLVHESESEFLASTDPWFRPVRAVVGPDGALWIVDMYRESIEHPEWIPDAWKERLNLRAGSDRGRIYRVWNNEQIRPAVTKVAQLELQSLVSSLLDPRPAYRNLVHQTLVERVGLHPPTPEIQQRLTAMLRDATQPAAQVHAMQLMSYWGCLTAEHLTALLKSEHFGVLRNAVTLAEPMLNREPELLQGVVDLAQHADGRVRLSVALAMGQCDDPRAGICLAEMASASSEVLKMDRWLATAISASATHHSTEIIREMMAASSTSTNDFSDSSERLLVDLLRTIASSGGEPVELVQEWLMNDALRLEWRLAVASACTRSMRRGQMLSPMALDVLKPIYVLASDMMVDEDQSESLRCEAMNLMGLGLGAASQESELLVSLLRTQNPLSIQRKAIEVLSRNPVPERAMSVVERWPALSQTVRDAFVEQMLSTNAWNEALVASLEQGAIGVNDLNAAARQRIRLTGSRSLQVRADRVLGSIGTLEKRTLVEEYLKVDGVDANLENGKALFAQHCAVCHIAKDNQPAVGASLANLSNRSSRFLMESILDPNRAVDPRYQAYAIQTTDDRIVMGAIENESSTQVQLAHADGSRTSLSRREIAEIKNSRISLMPEGFERQLSPVQMRDLVRWLSTSYQEP